MYTGELVEKQNKVFIIDRQIVTINWYKQFTNLFLVYKENPLISSRFELVSICLIYVNL